MMTNLMRNFRVAAIVSLVTLMAFVAACDNVSAPEDELALTSGMLANQSKPNGPWLPDDKQVSLEGLRSYGQLWKTLEQIEHSASGSFQLDSAPRLSNTGRNIPVVTIGDGPEGILIFAQQHGNEFVVSEAMIELIRDLSDNSAESRAIRDAITLTVVPRVNVDGFDADIVDENGNMPPWRQNYDPHSLSSCPFFYVTGRGYDINRYHSFLPDPEAHPSGPSCGANPVPEAVAVRLLYDETTPSVVIDFHHQGSRVDEDGRLVTGSTMWPSALGKAEELSIVPQFEAAVELSKKVISVMVAELDRYGFANVTRYPGGTRPSIARNAYGLLGSGSVLFEMRGGIGIKSNGYITTMAYKAAKSVVAALANGSLYWADTSLADNLPEWGNRIGPPSEEDENHKKNRPLTTAIRNDVPRGGE
jgi:predicted deacylase